MDQGAPPPGDQGQAPAMDQNDAPPLDQNGAPPMDPNAPPADQAGAPDQGAPPPNATPDDQGAPGPDDSGADADGSTNFQTFYENLSSQGNWVQTDSYGYVWQPNVQDPQWAPYTNGHWVYTDEGWAWVADASEPWGWATYHYGRWVNLDSDGWVWVPGYTWAPAWVSWRYGGGYCGWAPLPPSTLVGIDFGGDGYGYQITGDCDTVFGIGPGYYHFVPIGYMGARDYRGHYANRYNNFTIINNTRNVTAILVHSRQGAGSFSRVSAGGPSFSMVNAQSRTQVQRVTLSRSGTVGNARLGGGHLAVFAPRLAATPAGVRPASVARNLGSVRANRGTNINQPLAVNARVRPAGPSAAQVQAAQGAQRHASTAGVATVNTRPSQALTTPLTSLRPHGATAAGGRPASVPSNVNRPAAASNTRPESAFTGETGAREQAATHSSPGNSSPANTEERQQAEAQRQAQARQQTESRQAEAQHQAQAQQQTEARQAENQRQAEGQRQAEAQRQAEGQRQAEAQRQAEGQRQAEAQRQAEGQRQAQHQAEAQRQAAQPPAFHPQAQPHPSAPQPQAHPQAQPHGGPPAGHPGSQNNKDQKGP
jgi:hypothetical protein